MGDVVGTFRVLLTGTVHDLSEMHPDDDFEYEQTVLDSLGVPRSALAGRYLRLGLLSAAHGKLAAWRDLREAVAELVATIPTRPGGRRGRRRDRATIDGAAERRASDEARRLIERVRARTLDLLGDQAGAMAVVERTLCAARAESR